MQKTKPIISAVSATVLGLSLVGCQTAGESHGPNAPGAEMQFQRDKAAEANRTFESRVGQRPPASDTPYTRPGPNEQPVLTPDAAAGTESNRSLIQPRSSGINSAGVGTGAGTHTDGPEYYTGAPGSSA